MAATKTEWATALLTILRDGVTEGFITPADAPCLEDIDPDFPDLKESLIGPRRTPDEVSALIDKALKDGKAEAVATRIGNILLGLLK